MQEALVLEHKDQCSALKTYDVFWHTLYTKFCYVVLWQLVNYCGGGYTIEIGEPFLHLNACLVTISLSKINK